jgi:hypothetical protein
MSFRELHEDFVRFEREWLGVTPASRPCTAAMLAGFGKTKTVYDEK